MNSQQLLVSSDAKPVTVIKPAAAQTMAVVKLSQPQKVLLTKISAGKTKIRKARQVLNQTKAPPTAR